MSKTLAGSPGGALITSISQASGGTTRGRLDLTAVDGGIITLAITNGGTAPTTQCVGRVLVAHKQTSMPAAGAEGTADDAWKQVAEFGGSTVISAKSRFQYRFGPEVAYAEVEFTGNTGQAVTVEAGYTTFVYG